MSSNCHFPENIFLFTFYLHSFWLQIDKLILNWIMTSLNGSICNFLCCSKTSVVENVLSEWIYASSCSCHFVFLVLLKKLWKKFSITYKKFVFLHLRFFTFEVNKTSNFFNNFTDNVTYYTICRISISPGLFLFYSFFMKLIERFVKQSDKFHCLPIY